MLNFQTLQTLLQMMAAGAQAASSTVLNFAVGTVFRALFQGVASGLLWMQYLILQVLQQAFLTSSTGTQVDNWLEQFPLFGGRIQAVTSDGQVTFSRFTATSSALIPALNGTVLAAQVRTADGTQTFNVIPDTTNPLWNAAQWGYLIPAGTASATVPVEAVTAGTGGNVGANTITQIVGSLPGIDAVNNADAFTNGEAAESDAAVKLRFQNWQTSLAEGTYPAVATAASSVSTNITFEILPNSLADGTYAPGFFTVVIDDGSGATPSGTVTAVANAVNAVRPLGTTAYVVAATKLAANVTLTLTVGSNYSVSDAQAAVNAALATYIGSLAVGATLAYNIIPKIAFDAYPGITNVTLITLNGGATDLVPTTGQVVRAGTIVVNP